MFLGVCFGMLENLESRSTASRSVKNTEKNTREEHGEKYDFKLLKITKVI